MIAIWERYIAKEILKVFFLFLMCFFILYVAIDYSIHFQGFLKSTMVDAHHLLTYYGYQFIKRANILFPLAGAVATIKVLTNMNAHHELLALQSSGMALKKLLRPFLLLGIATTLFNYASNEYLLPRSMDFTDMFEAQYLKNSSPEERQNRIRVLELKDGSKLAFQSFDAQTKIFHDLFWIRSTDDIWRIKALKIDDAHPEKTPLGCYVDHLKRNAQGIFVKAASYPTIRLAPLKSGSYMARKIAIPLENRSISQLFYLLRHQDAQGNYHQVEITSQLAVKLSLPILSFLALLGIIPFCVRFFRHRSLFPLYTIGVFSIIGFFVLLQAGAILSNNQVLHPLLAIALPSATTLLILTWKFARL